MRATPPGPFIQARRRRPGLPRRVAQVAAAAVLFLVVVAVVYVVAAVVTEWAAERLIGG